MFCAAQVIRPMYSSPPRHGAAIVVEILSNPQLYREWRVCMLSFLSKLCSGLLLSSLGAICCLWLLLQHVTHAFACSLLHHCPEEQQLRHCQQCLSESSREGDAPDALLQEELSSMAGRIKRMRAELYQALQHVGAPGSWRPVTEAIGMFAMLGLSKARACTPSPPLPALSSCSVLAALPGMEPPFCLYWPFKADWMGSPVMHALTMVMGGSVLRRCVCCGARRHRCST